MTEEQAAEARRARGKSLTKVRTGRDSPDGPSHSTPRRAVRAVDHRRAIRSARPFLRHAYKRTRARARAHTHARARTYLYVSIRIYMYLYVVKTYMYIFICIHID